jgi:3-hydroxyacyl-[acyl-carrier-protein] dehydratase
MTTDIKINIREIMSFIPHRYPFIMIDKVESIELNKSLVAIKNVTINEPFFTGHFPVNPIMPGVLIVEAMAQASAILTIYSNKDKINKIPEVYFGAIKECKFRKMVVPGDVLRIEVKNLKMARNIGIFECNSFVGDDLVAKATITAAINWGELSS